MSPLTYIFHDSPYPYIILSRLRYIVGVPRFHNVTVRRRGGAQGAQGGGSGGGGVLSVLCHGCSAATTAAATTVNRLVVNGEERTDRRFVDHTDLVQEHATIEVWVGEAGS
jgi:hypothetical protein